MDVDSIWRELMKVPSATLKEYLKRLGLPGNWARADEAIEKLTQAGFPVSAAAQEMLRRFGDLDSLRNRPPAPAKTPDVRHTPARICIDPFDVLTEGETVAEVEDELGVQGLCAIGYSGNGGIMCIGEDGTVWFSESAFGYAGSTPDEVIERLLEGRPNR